MKIVKPVRAIACNPDDGGGCGGGNNVGECLSQSGWKRIVACLA